VGSRRTAQVEKREEAPVVRKQAAREPLDERDRDAVGECLSSPTLRSDVKDVKVGFLRQTRTIMSLR
jgi:hypothetical protein